MKRFTLFIQLAALAFETGSLCDLPNAFAQGIAPAQDEAPATQTGVNEFSAYQLLIDRNVFNPNRKGPAVVVERPVEKPKNDELILVGTLVTETGSFAFFNGTSSAFQSVLKPGDEIAGCKIETITTQRIALSANDRPIELKVGMFLTREPQGQWEIAAGPSSMPSSSRRSRAAGSDAAKSAESGEKTDAAKSSGESNPSDANDILKKLMERRKQEIK